LNVTTIWIALAICCLDPVRLVVSNVSDRKERWPRLKGAIHLAASLKSHVLVVVVMMMMEMVHMMVNVRLCTWNRAN
jgi:hypothetical protein